MSIWTQLVPVVPVPADGEGLDGYLERVACANGIDRPALSRLCQTSSPLSLGTIPLFLPDPLADHISTLTNLSKSAITAMTLEGYRDRLPYRMTKTGVDASALQSLRRQGWFPPKGSAYCPRCLAVDGIWRLSWRLPFVTMCLDHQLYLNWQCGDCRKMPRSVRSTVFKGHMDNPAVCGNPNGTKTPCTGDLSSAQCFPAPTSQLCFAGRIKTALAGGRVSVCGQEVMSREYLSSLKALAIVLLQLASAQPRASLSQTLIPSEFGKRLVDRHWAVAPPRDTALRSRVLACADTLLSATTDQAAAEDLREWVSLVPQVGEARLKWLSDRSPADPLIMKLLRMADQDRWRVSRLLSSTELRQGLSVRAVPQQLPEHLYSRHLAPLLTTRSTIGRLFGSLSIVRIVVKNATWARAAKELGLPPAVGPRTARTVHQRIIADPQQLHSAIVSIAGELDCSRDWRVEEDRVRDLNESRATWVQTWLHERVSGSRARSAPYAVTYRWIHEAHGLLMTTPAWSGPPGPDERAQYRSFEKRLRLRN
jgi:hypothetical protein